MYCMVAKEWKAVFAIATYLQFYLLTLFRLFIAFQKIVVWKMSPKIGGVIDGGKLPSSWSNIIANSYNSWTYLLDYHKLDIHNVILLIS